MLISEHRTKREAEKVKKGNLNYEIRRIPRTDKWYDVYQVIDMGIRPRLKPGARHNT